MGEGWLLACKSLILNDIFVFNWVQRWKFFDKFILLYWDFFSDVEFCVGKALVNPSAQNLCIARDDKLFLQKNVLRRTLGKVI